MDKTIKKNKVVKYYQEYNGYKPYDYQKKVAKLMLEGENVMLKAPTGVGKTSAATMPFVIAQREDIDFPKRLIYSTPRRTLVNNLYEDYKDIYFDLKTSIQTGESNEDKYFQNDLIFTTLDQSLSSMLSIPISLSNSLGNINVSSLLNSFLIFDEFHLFDKKRAYLTTLKILKELDVRFCIMTATLNKFEIEKIANMLDCKLVNVYNEKSYENIKVLNSVEKSLEVVEDKFNIKDILKQHKNIKTKSKKSLVIANRVKTAQKVYEKIKKELKKEKKNTEVILIHSRFNKSDRKRKEERIYQEFRKKNANVILISTQVVEVGVNISSNILHTELADISSLIQRMGRTARFENEFGKIKVYDIYNDSNNKYLPYQKEKVLVTKKVLKKYSAENERLNVLGIDKIIDRVYENFNIKDENNDFNLLDCWKKDNIKNEYYKEYIRNIQSVSLIVGKNKKEVFNKESVSLSFYSFYSKFKMILKELEKSKVNKRKTSEKKWVAKKVIDFKKKRVKKCKAVKDIKANTLYLLNPEFFSYTKNKGLELNINNSEKRIENTFRKREKGDCFDNNYHFEDYFTHIKLVNGESEKLIKEFGLLSEISKISNLSKREVKDLIDFIIYIHDFGKFQDGWQKNHSNSKNRLLAHGKRKTNVSNHSNFSVIFASKLAYLFVKNYLSNQNKKSIFRCILKTVINHHSSNNFKYNGDNTFNFYKGEDFTINYLKSNNKDYFTNQKMLKFINDNLVLNKKRFSVNEKTKLKTINEFKIYFHLVRILRLSDQKATKKYQKKGK